MPRQRKRTGLPNGGPLETDAPVPKLGDYDIDVEAMAAMEPTPPTPGTPEQEAVAASLMTPEGRRMWYARLAAGIGLKNPEALHAWYLRKAAIDKLYDGVPVRGGGVNVNVGMMGGGQQEPTLVVMANSRGPQQLQEGSSAEVLDVQAEAQAAELVESGEDTR